MLRFVYGPGHLVIYCLKGVRTRIGQKKPGDLKMTNNLGTIDALAYLIVLTMRSTCLTCCRSWRASHCP
jgi:hypothetical protein